MRQQRLTTEKDCMTKKRILVVDDEQDLCEILLFNLTAAGYEAEAAYSAEEAMDKISSGVDSNGYDLLLLDVMMPGMSGFELAQHLRQYEPTMHTPVMFLTAKDAEDDVLQGFGLGADDYVTKPFSVREVMARVKAVLGRTALPQAESAISFEAMAVDTVSKRVTIDGEDIPLTKTEYELLCLLLTHRGQVFTRQQLLDEVWPHNVVVSDRTVDVNITRLRKKIGRYGSNIIARHGFGYCFEN